MAGNEMVPREETGVSYRDDFSGTEVIKQAETTIAMMAAQSKALIEARFIVAMRAGRNIEKLRLSVGDLCRNPKFAETALYLKPVSKTPRGWAMLPMRDRLRSELLKRERNRGARPGDDNEQEWPMGFNIRFIEAAIAEAGHIDVNATVIWEDDEKRITKVDVVDLYKNIGWSRTVVTKKTVERRKLGQDQEPLFTRRNSFGDILFVVEATEAEVLQAEAASVSKSVRTMAERIFPGHLKLEWRQIVEATILNEAAQDPEGKRKEIIDAFHTIGIEPDHLSKYLEHDIALLQPAEYLSLKVIYSSIRSGEITWAQVMESKFGPAEGAEETKGARALKDKLEKKVAELRTEQQKPPAAATAAPPAAPPAPGPTTPTEQPPAQQAKPEPQSAPSEAVSGTLGTAKASSLPPQPSNLPPVATATDDIVRCPHCHVNVVASAMDAHLSECLSIKRGETPQDDLFADKKPAEPDRSLKTYGAAADFPALPDVFDVKPGLEVYFIEGKTRKRLRAEEDTWKLVSAEDYMAPAMPPLVPPGPQVVPEAGPQPAAGFNFHKGKGKR